MFCLYNFSFFLSIPQCFFKTFIFCYSSNFLYSKILSKCSSFFNLLSSFLFKISFSLISWTYSCVLSTWLSFSCTLEVHYDFIILLSSMICEAFSYWLWIFSLCFYCDFRIKVCDFCLFFSFWIVLSQPSLTIDSYSSFFL